MEGTYKIVPDEEDHDAATADTTYAAANDSTVSACPSSQCSVPGFVEEIGASPPKADVHVAGRGANRPRPHNNDNSDGFQKLGRSLSRRFLNEKPDRPEAAELLSAGLG